LLPILQILSRTTGMSKEERTQAAAVGVAARVMNQFLYEYTWENIADGKAPMNGTEFLDGKQESGVEFKWTATVQDAWPVTQEMDVYRTRYHPGCGGACSYQIEPCPRRSPSAINPQFCSRVGSIVFKTIAVTFQWKGPGDPDYLEAHKMVLVTRRAMLEEANQ